MNLNVTTYYWSAWILHENRITTYILNYVSWNRKSRSFLHDSSAAKNLSIFCYFFVLSFSFKQFVLYGFQTISIIVRKLQLVKNVTWNYNLLKRWRRREGFHSRTASLNIEYKYSNFWSQETHEEKMSVLIEYRTRTHKKGKKQKERMHVKMNNNVSEIYRKNCQIFVY